MISAELVEKLGLEVHDQPHPYPLGWVRQYMELRVTKQFRFKFAISASVIDEVEANVIPLDFCGVLISILGMLSLKEGLTKTNL